MPSLKTLKKFGTATGVAAAITTGWTTVVAAGSVGASYTPVLPPAANVPEVSTAGAVAALTVAVGIAVLIYERRKARA